MSPAPFDNIISKFKASTKQAADQMSKAAKVARLKMDIMSLVGEKTRHLQNIGTKTYELFSETSGLDGSLLSERVRQDFTQVQRIEGRIRELESEIADLQAMVQSPEPSDVAEADSVKDVSQPADTASTESKPQNDATS